MTKKKKIKEQKTQLFFKRRDESDQMSIATIFSESTKVLLQILMPGKFTEYMKSNKVLRASKELFL